MKKKLYSLLALLFTFCGLTAMADAFVPVSGTKYLIYRAGYFATVASTTSSTQLTSSSTSPTYYVFVASSTTSTDSYYYGYIYAVIDGTYYPVNSGSGVVIGDAQTTATGATTEWQISTTTVSGESGYFIEPKGGSTSWNMNGGDGNGKSISLWSSTQNGSWNIQSLSEYMSALGSDLNGYYTFSCKDNSRAMSLYNDFTNTSNTNGLTLQDASQVGTANNYVWKITTSFDEENLTKSISLVNGQGTHLVYGSSWNSGATECESMIIDSYSDGSFSDGSIGNFYFTNGLNGSASNQSHFQVGGINYVTTWTDGGASKDDNNWYFTPVDDNFYAVTVTGNDNGYAISGDEVAKNGGFITSPVSVTAAEIDDYKSTVSTDDDAKTVTITYTEMTDAEKYAVRYATATSLLADADKVGYPASSSDVYKTLAAFKENASATDADVTSLTTAISNYKTTTDVVLPEDGKVYQIVAKFYAGEELPVYWNSELAADDASWTGRFAINIDGTLTDAQKRASYFFCHKISDGTYLFVNKDGRYLRYFQDQNYAASSTTAYDAANNACVISRSVLTNNWGNGKDDATLTIADLYGLLSIVQGGNYLTPRLANGDFVGAGANIYYDTASPYRTHGYKFVDVSDQITLLSAIPSDRTYATFSTPFPVTLPASLGLTAYTATEGGYTYTAGEGSNPGTIQLAQLGTEGEDVVIPENTGILLHNKNGNAIAAQNLVPAEDATEAVIATTGLVATGADEDTSDRTLDTDTYSYYVLGNGSSGIGFYTLGTPQFNPFKAFLVLTKNTSSSIKLVFDGDNTTSIDAATLNVESNAPVYDLTGRRVVKTAKGGLYIQNGKKYIAR